MSTLFGDIQQQVAGMSRTVQGPVIDPHIKSSLDDLTARLVKLRGDAEANPIRPRVEFGGGPAVVRVLGGGGRRLGLCERGAQRRAEQRQ